jgi:hypothetical protein
VSVYRSSSIKRGRRTKKEIEVLQELLEMVLKEEHPMTVRQVFYQMVSRGYIEKTENQYKNVVVRLLSKMRIEGQIPFGWVADSTRWQRKPRTYSSLEQAIRRTAETYRRSCWDNQDAYVEIWLEKDALAGVLLEETKVWDVPLMVTRGYSSLSYLYEAADFISDLEKPAYLYYFGDYDPSGLDIPRNVEKRLREFAPDSEINFERVAVTEAQIQAWGLPTRPTKRTDSRTKSFKGESVEVDAIPPKQLRELASDCIIQHIDEHEWNIMEQTEASEKQILEMFAREGIW